MMTGWNSGRRPGRVQGIRGLGLAALLASIVAMTAFPVSASATENQSPSSPAAADSQKVEKGKVRKKKPRAGSAAKSAAGPAASPAASPAATPASGESPAPGEGLNTATSGSKAKPEPRTKSRAARKPPAGRRWGPFGITGSLDFQSIYDSNIFRYSPINLNRARTGDFRPGEFDLDTFDDFIFMARPNLNLGFRLLGTRESSVRFSYVRWQYFRNPHKSNDAWMVRFRQPTIDRDFLELGYTYAPMALIRPLGDRGPFEPFSSTPYLYYPFEMARNTFLFAYQRRVTDRLTARFEGGRVIRYYNQRFIENDNWEWNGTLALNYTLYGPWRLGGRYSYSNVKARAIDTVGELRSATNDGDPSYDRDLYQASVDFVPKGGFLSAFSAFGVMGQYQTYWYTSKLPYWEDNTHVGRKDEVYVIESTLTTRPFYGPLDLELGYRYTARESSSGAAADLEEDKNYHNHRAWLGWSIPF